MQRTCEMKMRKMEMDQMSVGVFGKFISLEFDQSKDFYLNNTTFLVFLVIFDYALLKKFSVQYALRFRILTNAIVSYVCSIFCEKCSGHERSNID